MDKYRQVQTNKTFLLWFQKKWHMAPFFCCCNYATVCHIGMIICYSSSSTVFSLLTLAKPITHLPICSLNIRELELNRCSKDQLRKVGGSPAWGEGGRGGNPTPPAKTWDLLNGFIKPIFILTTTVIIKTYYFCGWMAELFICFCGLNIRVERLF